MRIEYYRSFLNRFSGRPDDESGIILIIVLWILVILSLLAMGLSRRASIELELIKYSIAQAKANQVAMAGIRYALYHIRERAKENETGNNDTRYQCGFTLKGDQHPEELFKNIRVADGFFTISFSLQDDGAGDIRYGFADEESRININALSYSDYDLFRHLLLQSGVDQDTSEQIASAVVDWRDANQEVFNAPRGAEDDYYTSLERPYHCKNGPFNSLEELMLVRGMTADIFQKIKPYVTIFPAQGEWGFNLDTASAPVLRALARFNSGPKTNTDLSDADSLVEKILIYRSGGDGLWATQDDLPVNFNAMALNAKERVIAFLMKNAQKNNSQFLRIAVHAVDEGTKVTARINAVVKVEDGTIVYWYRG